MLTNCFRYDIVKVQPGTQIGVIKVRKLKAGIVDARLLSTQEL